MWQSTQSNWFLAVNRFALGTPVLYAPMKLYAEYGVGLFAAVLRARRPVTYKRLVFATPLTDIASIARRPRICRREVLVA